jgi:hypothetical protein
MNGRIQGLDLHLDQVGGGSERAFVGSLGVNQQDASVNSLLIKPQLQSDHALQDVFIRRNISVDGDSTLYTFIHVAPALDDTHDFCVHGPVHFFECQTQQLPFVEGAG